MNKMQSGLAAMATAMVALGLSALATNDAQATEGYFQTGYGAIQKSLAGAGPRTQPQSRSIQPGSLTSASSSTAR